MRECIQPYFVKDGLLQKCSSFHMRLINEGRSIYEVARLSGTRLLFLDDHIDRLFTSLKLEGFESWLDIKEIHQHLNLLIQKNQSPEGNVKFVMNFTPNQNPCFLAYFVAHRYPSAEDYINGVRVITFPFERIDPNKKVWRPEFRRKVTDEIREKEAFEALLTDANGMFPEASKANVFGVKEGRIITPPDKLILPGITRKYVLSACRELNIPVEMRTIALDEIKDLDALFLTGTSIQVLPVRKVDETGVPTQNMIIREIMKQLEKKIKTHLK